MTRPTQLEQQIVEQLATVALLARVAAAGHPEAVDWFGLAEDISFLLVQIDWSQT